MKAFLITLIGALLLVLGGQVSAAEPAYQFEDPEKQQLFHELTAELRCPMCQNQNIADSDAMIAHDLRRKVYELLQQGRSREEVVDYMKDRYGDFVSYQPPVTAVTIWLWILPVLFVLMALLFIWQRNRKPVAQVDASSLAKADEILEKDE